VIGVLIVITAVLGVVCMLQQAHIDRLEKEIEVLRVKLIGGPWWK